MPKKDTKTTRQSDEQIRKGLRAKAEGYGVRGKKTVDRWVAENFKNAKGKGRAF